MGPTLRLFLASLALVVIIGARGALQRPDWLQVLLGILGPVATLVGGLFPRMIHPSAVPAFLVLALGCALLGAVLPLSAETRWRSPTLEPRRPARGARAAAVGLLVLAASLCVWAAFLLRRNPPPDLSIAVWLAALGAGAGAALVLDRGRRTPLGFPLRGRTDWLIAAALVVGNLLLVGHDLAHWRWAGTPDESNFFPFARALADGSMKRFLLEEPGMYGVHPILSSYWQALFMRVFGLDVFGWRLSSAAALALSLPCVYVLGRELWSRRFGVWAAVLFGATPLAVGFAHFGYNNTQVYPIVTGSLAAFVWAARRRSLTGYYVAGTIAGLSVFTFYPARAALPLLFLLAVALRALPWRRGERQAWGLLLAAAAIAATPCAVHPVDTLGRMFGQTAFQGAPAPDAPPPALSEVVAERLARLARHFTASVLHPLWHPNPSHFQRSSVVDPLQAALAMAGLVVAWRRFRPRAGRAFHPGYRFVALAYPFCALTVGAVSQHDTPPLTRLLFLCPFTSMLAAGALDEIVRAGEPLGRRPRWAAAVGGLAVAAASLWGQGILRHNVYVLTHGYGEGTTSEIVRILRALPKGWRVVYVQRVPTYMNNVDVVAAQFGTRSRLSYLRYSDQVVGQLPPAQRRNVLVLHDLREAAERELLEAEVLRRFPGGTWTETAPGQRWNFRAYAVGRAGPEIWQPPPLPERSTLGSVTLGFLDW